LIVYRGRRAARLVLKGRGDSDNHGVQPVSMLAFKIRGWAAWAPGLESEAAWRAWAAGGAGQSTSEPAGASATAVPMLLRRRVSPLGQAALRCAWGLPDAARARIVSASRHGEFGRTLSILDALCTGETVSPADFTLSVHHALTGLLSIAQSNRNGHTAVAAGPESFESGFIEAVACLQERPAEPVVLVYYDEPLPSPFDRFDTEAGPTLAMALSLSSEQGESFLLGTGTADEGAPPPESPGLAFLRFLLTEQPQTSWRGARRQWHWRRLAEAA
jgi:hypothetical protein